VFDEILRLAQIKKHFNERAAAVIVNQILQAINYCHLKGIVH